MLGSLLLIASSFPAVAGVLEGELGQWLTQEVAPKLTRHVGKHPRFAGVTLEVVALEDQRPTTNSNELVRAIADYLQHRLLEQSQARIAWDSTGVNCRPAQTATLLLGIEVRGSGGRHQVNIRGLDPEEAVWLPGVSYRWRGNLATAERRALRQTVLVGAKGSRARPFELSQHGAIAAALQQQAACLPRYALDGTVGFASTGDLRDVGAEDAAAFSGYRSLVTAVRDRFATSRSFTVAQSSEAADWLLDLQLLPAGQDLGELRLTAEADGVTQTLASTFVVPKPASQATPDVPRPTVFDGAKPTLALLSALQRVEGQNCPRTLRAQGSEFCTAVELELRDPGFLFSFRIENERVISNQCGRDLEHSAAGKRRFRLKLVPDSQVTFYVLATRERELARSVHRLLSARSTSCNGARAFDAERWLTRLARVTDNAPALSWQALALPSEPGELVASNLGE